MEELKILVEMVANLPSMALWVIAMLFAYKADGGSAKEAGYSKEPRWRN